MPQIKFKVDSRYFPIYPPNKKVEKEIKNYLSWVKEEWKNKGKLALRELANITGLSTQNIKITVFITHPKLCKGINLPPQKAIIWGHKEDWKNYTVVYLCHELLHIMTDGKYKDGVIMHAIIELATDNELRVRLNGKSNYFKEGKYKIGHQYLRNLEKKILPKWKKYLKHRLPIKNILELEKTITNQIKKSPGFK